MASSLFVLLLVMSAIMVQSVPVRDSTANDVVDSVTPRHVQLSLTGRGGERQVSWVTSTSTVLSVVEWREHGSGLEYRAPGKSIVFNTTGHIGNDTYEYRVGNGKLGPHGWSKWFTLSPIKETGLTFAVYGDFGIINDVSLARLVNELDAGAFDAILHVGDFAYDLNTNNGKVGDDWLEAMQPLTTRVPMNVCPGNHEAAGNFTHFIHRFWGVTQGAGVNCGSDTNLWYSFEVDGVHFLSLDTELLESPTATQAELIAQQMTFIDDDLKKVDRDRTPWVIALAHKSWYMDSLHWSNFSTSLHQGGVDVMLTGHQHNYQRFLPSFSSDGNATVWDTSANQSGNVTYTNPKYMVSIVAGSPGCQEKIAMGYAFESFAPVSEEAYGFGHLHVVNSTHLEWEWQAIDPKDPKSATVVDKLLLVQEGHGRRQLPRVDEVTDNQTEK